MKGEKAQPGNTSGATYKEDILAREGEEGRTLFFSFQRGGVLTWRIKQTLEK